MILKVSEGGLCQITKDISIIDGGRRVVSCGEKVRIRKSEAEVHRVDNVLELCVIVSYEVNPNDCFPFPVKYLLILD